MNPWNLLVEVLNINAPAVVPKPTVLLTCGKITNVLIPLYPSFKSTIHLGAVVPIPTEPTLVILNFSSESATGAAPPAVEFNAKAKSPVKCAPSCVSWKKIAAFGRPDGLLTPNEIPAYPCA